jgi:hypothetical protein
MILRRSEMDLVDVLGMSIWELLSFICSGVALHRGKGIYWKFEGNG